ncbi:MAG: SLC13/DASS family transporter [Myxococcales bacterium]|nr:SLC13/DASS family transporter [Myxococcales bacterium]
MLEAAGEEQAISAGEVRFNALRRRVGLIAAPVGFVAMLAWPLQLELEAHRLAAITLATVILWVTEAIPLSAAALLAPTLAVLMSVAPAEVAFAPMAHPLIFLFLGGFMLARALSLQGLDRRAALWLLSRRWIAGSPARALVAIALTGFVFSMWISNTATAAMLVPVATGLCATIASTAGDEADGAGRDDEDAPSFRRFTEGVLLALAYSCSLGGMTTPIGTAPNVIAIGMLEDMVGVRVDFFAWMRFALPTALVSMVVVLGWALWRFRAPVERMRGLTEVVQRQLAALGPVTPGERRVSVIFGLTVLGWLTPSLLRLVLGEAHPWTRWGQVGLEEGVVALLAALALSVLPSGAARERGGQTEPIPLLPWGEALRIDWGTLYLLGGGLALGKLMFSTGLAAALAEGMLALAGPITQHPFGLLAIATTLMIGLTEFTSNTATTSMMLPVLIAIASASGVDPVPVALCVTLAASYAFMLPVATPPNAIVYGTQQLRIDTMLRFGFVLDIAGVVILLGLGLILIGAS